MEKRDRPYLFDEKRRSNALSKADQAFWEVIVAEYPEISTGDLDIEHSIAWGEAEEEVLREWLRQNNPHSPWEFEHDRTYRVPDEVMSLVRSGVLVDASYHNDVCPKFSLGNRYCDEKCCDDWCDYLDLWVEHIDPNKREGNNGKRYCVSSGQFGEDILLDTDDFAAALAALFRATATNHSPECPSMADAQKATRLENIEHMAEQHRQNVGSLQQRISDLEAQVKWLHNGIDDAYTMLQEDASSLLVEHLAQVLKKYPAPSRDDEMEELRLKLKSREDVIYAIAAQLEDM